METEHIHEITKVANEAAVGNWIPAAIVGSLLGLIIILLLAIYGKDKKSNNKRHEDSEKLIQSLASNHDELSKITITQGNILAELKGKVEARE